jgi:hypothetical protein
MLLSAMLQAMLPSAMLAKRCPKPMLPEPEYNFPARGAAAGPCFKPSTALGCRAAPPLFVVNPLPNAALNLSLR